MKQEINLEEILNSIVENTNPHRDRVFFKEDILKAMKEACNQVLDLAAENAYTKEMEVAESIHGGPSYTYEIVDADSILQIKDWIK
jgi:hypothetical protein